MYISKTGYCTIIENVRTRFKFKSNRFVVSLVFFSSRNAARFNLGRVRLLTKRLDDDEGIIISKSYRSITNVSCPMNYSFKRFNVTNGSVLRFASHINCSVKLYSSVVSASTRQNSQLNATHRSQMIWLIDTLPLYFRCVHHVRTHNTPYIHCTL